MSGLSGETFGRLLAEAEMSIYSLTVERDSLRDELRAARKLLASAPNFSAESPGDWEDRVAAFLTRTRSTTR